MAFSTNLIIHYTSSLAILMAILDEGFKIKYCNEELRLGIGSSNTAHPMVSFCDIPLSNSQNHFNAYGEYGIGLTKEWASKNKINPVLYIDRHSLIAEIIHELIKSNMQEARIHRIKSCAKNYSGAMNKGNMPDSISEYRFYDEREWRFIPCREDKEFTKCKSAISLKTEIYLENKDKYNEQVSGYRLRFEPNDISYIIVKSTKEVPALINFLRKNYTCTGDQLDILLSKVCTTEQIQSDY